MPLFEKIFIIQLRLIFFIPYIRKLTLYLILSKKKFLPCGFHGNQENNRRFYVFRNDFSARPNVTPKICACWIVHYKLIYQLTEGILIFCTFLGNTANSIFWYIKISFFQKYVKICHCYNSNLQKPLCQLVKQA